MTQRLQNIDMSVKREVQELQASFKGDVAKLNIERLALAAAIRQEMSDVANA